MTWKQKTLLIGVVLGALSGLAAALLYIRSLEDKGKEQPSKITTGDALKVGFSLFGFIRQVTDLAK
jgi:gas vesicle protein